MLLHELRDPIAAWNLAQTPTAGFVSKKEARREGASDRASASWATLGAGWIGPPQPGHL